MLRAQQASAEAWKVGAQISGDNGGLACEFQREVCDSLKGSINYLSTQYFELGTIKGKPLLCEENRYWSAGAEESALIDKSITVTENGKPGVPSVLWSKGSRGCTLC